VTNSLLMTIGKIPMSYVYILLTILLTIYSQLVLKFQVVNAGVFPNRSTEKIWFLIRLLANPGVISVYLAWFLASLAWMAALRELPLSYAYPFTSLTFVFILALSGVLFHEAITPPKMIGMSLIVLGIFIGSRG
jgi:multidrug transporter EmrE-like cation transporter